MADVGDDLLDGDLDETAFGELDGEEEDALLADDDYESYQNSRQVFQKSSQQGEGRTEIFHMVDQVQDVSEGDEILEDGEDVLELAVVDELDESELDNGQGNNQTWNETLAKTVIADNRQETTVGVPSSTSGIGALGGESDEEETDGRGSRFKTERTNIISLKGVTSIKSLKEIPDSLDKVKTVIPSSGMRPRGGMQRGGRGGVRGRLGPMQRGGMMMRGGFGPMRGRPNMMAPPPQPAHKIHVNPHFRGGMHHPPSVWNNERLPPPPGCESFGSTAGPQNQEGSWGPPHAMVRPPFPPQHPGPPVQFQNSQMYHHPQHPQQGYEEQQFQPPAMSAPQQNQPGRIVQFSENTQLITVENQHFQRLGFDQNFTPPNNQFPPPQNPPPQHFNNNNMFPNQYNNSSPRPNFQQQPFPPPNPPQNYPAYPHHEFHPPDPPPYQNFENQNSWNSPPQPVGNQQNQFYPTPPPTHAQPPPAFLSPQQPPFNPPFQNHQPNFRSRQTNQFQSGMKGSALKRLAPRQTLNSPAPLKQLRFDHNKQKTPPVNIRTNLQEIKTVDNLPDTTTAQEPDPEIEEDEETKQYRLKIAEQKALREKILKEKEARRLAAIIEKQKHQETPTKNIADTVVKQVSTAAPQQQFPKPQQYVVPRPQQPVFPRPQQPAVPRQQQPVVPRPQQPFRQPLVNRGRGRGSPVNRMIPKQQAKPQLQTPEKPVVKIQQMLGTMYKIVKVRTKEGAIVTRKTPLVMNAAGTAATPMRPVNTSGPLQRRVVLNAPQQPSVRMTGRGGMIRGNMSSANSTRMQFSANQTQGRTLFTVKTSPLANLPRAQASPRVVRLPNPAIKVAATPALPVSSLVTIDNLSLSTSQAQLQKLAKQVGNISSFKHEPDLKRATLRFQKPQEAEKFYLKFHRKMIDLSRIVVTVVPE